MNILPDLPREKQVFALQEYTLLQHWLHATVEDLAQIEEHLKICAKCFAAAALWETRALLLEQLANLQERIQELEGGLEFLEN